MYDWFYSFMKGMVTLIIIFTVVIGIAYLAQLFPDVMSVLIIVAILLMCLAIGRFIDTYY